MKQIPQFFIYFFALIYFSSFLCASEVMEETPTSVIVREHPKTEKPYVSIVSSKISPSVDPFTGQRKWKKRPNYRMLDPKIKAGEIPYDGPSSSAKKVYIFAASLATLGVAGGAIGMAIMPAAAGGAATGGGAYLAAGGAVAGGTTAAAVLKTKPDPNQDDFIQISESKSLISEEGEARSVNGSRE